MEAAHWRRLCVLCGYVGLQPTGRVELCPKFSPLLLGRRGECGDEWGKHGERRVALIMEEN